MYQDAQVIVFASQKGGSGKTTLSGHIAVHAELSGSGPVALIDTDPQGSLSKWWNARECETPVFAQATVENLEQDIAMLRESGIRLIVIDTPPAVTCAITEVISYADLVVVPTRPSPHDLRAVGVTVDLVEYQKKPMIFVINSATPRARITSETAVSLSQHGTVAPVNLHNRVDFAASMIDGRTVGEINPNSRSAQEVAMLWRYMEDRLRRMQRGNDLASKQIGAPFEIELLTPVRQESMVVEKAAPYLPDIDELGDCELASNYPEAPLPPAVPVTNGKPAAPEPPVMQAPRIANGAYAGWNGMERRRIDIGPPGSLEERRRAPTFGRRNVQ